MTFVEAFVAVLRGLTVLALVASGAAVAQSTVNTTPSRQTLEEATHDSCAGVSEVVQRCAPRPDTAPAKPANDPLTRSRAATKAAFDRKDGKGRAAAASTGATPSSDAQRIGTVNVTGTADNQLSVEQVLQRALNPNAEGVLSADGKTITHYGPNGSRYDCVAKCVGPMCCAEVRALPNPARESNSIGR